MDFSERLPAETLLGIFRIVRDVFPVPSAKDISSSFGRKVTQAERTLRLLGWIPLTHVCARWRNSALCDASLWTDVPVVLGEAWMREFLNRSGEMRINIDWRAWQTQVFSGMVPWDLMQTSVVPQHYKRLRNFEAQLEADDPLFSLLSCTWPALEHLSLELTGDFPRYVLLGGDAPCLRYLSFYLESDTAGCDTFPWRAPFLRTLVVLDIYFHEGIAAASMDEFLNALNAMPHLKHLRLGNGIPSKQASRRPCPSCSPAAQVASTKLRTFALRGCWSMIHHVMEHIHPMPSGRLSIAVQDEDDVTQADLRSVYARLAAYSQRDSVPSSGFGAVEVRQSPSDIATIRAFRSSSTLTSTSWRPYPGNWHEGIAGTHPDLDIRLPWSDSLASALFSSLKDLTPAGLRVLSLNIPTADDLDRVVHRNIDTAVLRDVSVLQLNGMCGERVSRLLAVDSDGDAELQTFFPALRLVDVKSSEWQEVLGRSNFVDGRPLADTLDARLEAGFAIPAVYVRIKEPVQWLRDDPSSYMYGSAEKVLRQAERLETTPGVRLIGEEEIMYDLTL